MFHIERIKRFIITYKTSAILTALVVIFATLTQLSDHQLSLFQKNLNDQVISANSHGQGYFYNYMKSEFFVQKQIISLNLDPESIDENKRRIISQHDKIMHKDPEEIALIENLKSNSIDLQSYFSQMALLYDNKATQELNIYNRYMTNIDKQYQEGTIWSQLKSLAIILEMVSAIAAFIIISKQGNGEAAWL
jgi:hypothetical protein